jgi:hypothetical protein
MARANFSQDKPPVSTDSSHRNAAAGGKEGPKPGPKAKGKKGKGKAELSNAEVRIHQRPCSKTDNVYRLVHGSVDVPPNLRYGPTIRPPIIAHSFLIGRG